MRGIALVGLVDAILIGIALVIIGVPLVVPLMVLTFFAAFVPLIGAFVAGLVAVLIALVSGGLVDAALVLGAIVLVQQVEGHLLYPLLMARTVNLHPAVIVVALAAGGILGGIVGVFLAVPVAGIVSVVLEYVARPPAARVAAAGGRGRHGLSRYPPGGPVESRITRRVGSITDRPAVDHRRVAPRSRSAATRPFSRSGWWTVVRPSAAGATSSKPTIERSPGTERPRARAA